MIDWMNSQSQIAVIVKVALRKSATESQRLGEKFRQLQCLPYCFISVSPCLCGRFLELIATAIDARRSFRTIKAAEIGAQRISIEIGKPRKLIEEGEIDGVSRTVALVGDNQLGALFVFF